MFLVLCETLKVLCNCDVMYLGHLGSGLAFCATGPDALKLICRPVPSMARCSQ